MLGTPLVRPPFFADFGRGGRGFASGWPAASCVNALDGASDEGAAARDVGLLEDFSSGSEERGREGGFDEGAKDGTAARGGALSGGSDDGGAATLSREGRRDVLERGGARLPGRGAAEAFDAPGTAPL